MALRSALAGLAAVVAGLLLLAGALWPRRQRVALLDAGDPGGSATRRVLGRAAASLVDSVRGLTTRRVRLRPRRRGPGARLDLRALRPETLSGDEARQRADEALQPLAQSFALRGSAPGPARG